jgi:hypothetical protein
VNGETAQGLALRKVYAGREGVTVSFWDHG